MTLNSITAILQRLAKFHWLVLLAVVSGCTSWSYSELTIPNQLHDVRTQTQDNITVSVAILDDDQAKAHFGIDLGRYDIQAIWLNVRNGSGMRLWLLRAALDPDFFPADEIARMADSSISDDDLPRAQQRLRDESMRLRIEPKTVVEGFVFAPRAVGGRYVDVRLLEDAYEAEKRRLNQKKGGDPSDNRDLEFRFGFALPLPDGLFDYELLDPENTYPGVKLPDLNEDELRARLSALPCCSMAPDDQTPADPLNIAIIGDSADVLNSLSRVGWSFTHRITPGTVLKVVGASISDKSYPVSPVSSLDTFGRKQDFALQRARAGISQRNHMRLWMAPFTYRGQHVWVGQISRDIGIKLTPKSPTITTHVIDPEVDQAREYLLQTLLAGGFVNAFGFVEGAQAATMEDPAYNHVGDPYFSDGMRLVVELSPRPIAYGQVRSLMWRQSAAPVAEGQASGADDNVRAIVPID
ncbi:conserved hypothetical protein [Luminiphilus syltensis NOR5-1B]|uniref:LssY-like C-terminal domain-containing protein n=1 Tax=Luminiphilus syltensis NOR5-1B TaxID=565045 RepID=B8KXR5_9GAMM|nr:LssY C-terminal domain-containing protein [Luminiphilus syltensis]EED35894.1 conserved hypothetical protein [Luminiphilus syltensis NOR5-1B]